MSLPKLLRHLRWEEALIASVLAFSAVAFAVMRYPFTLMLNFTIVSLFVSDFGLIIPGYMLWRLYRDRATFVQATFSSVGLGHVIEIARQAAVLYGSQVLFANWLAIIPLVNSHLWDDFYLKPELWIWGTSATRAWARPHEPGITVPIDLCYLLFYYWVCFTSAILYIKDGKAESRRFTTAQALAGIITTILMLATPTLGPAFLDPGSVAGIREDEIGTMRAQDISTQFRAEVLANPHGFTLVPFLGIQAFPSMHVGATFLALLFLRKRHRWAFDLFLLPIIGAWIGTIYLGWHYIVDAPAGMAIVAFARWLAFRYIPDKSVGAAAIVPAN